VHAEIKTVALKCNVKMITWCIIVFLFISSFRFLKVRAIHSGRIPKG